MSASRSRSMVIVTLAAWVLAGQSPFARAETGYVIQAPQVPRDAKPVLVPQVGHSGSVESLCFSPDGKRLASGSWDNTAIVWDVTVGVTERRLCGHSDKVTSVSFSPDGRKLASGSWDGTVIIWDVQSGKAERTLRGRPGPVFSVCFSPDGRKVASGSVRMATVWDAKSGQAEHMLNGQEGSVTSLSFSPDGRHLACATIGRMYSLQSPAGPDRIVLWSTADWTEERSVRVDAGPPHSVSFSPDGKRLAWGSKESTVVWDVETWKQEWRFSGSFDAKSVCFSPDAKALVSASGPVTIWDLETGKALRALTGVHRWPVEAVCFSPDGGKVASGDFDGTIAIWDAGSWHARRTLEGQTSWVNSVSLDPQGKRLAAAMGSGAHPGAVIVWDIADGHVERQLTRHWRGGVVPMPDTVRSVCFSSDGTRLASSGTESAIIWDVDTWEVTKTLYGAPDPGGSIAFRANCEELVWGLEKWDVVSGRSEGRISLDSGGIRSVALAPSGRKVAVGLGEYSPGLGLKAGRGEIVVCDVEDGSVDRRLPANARAVTSLCFGPDGDRLASGTDDGAVMIWSAESGVLLRSLSARPGQVTCLCFSPDGRTLAVGYSSKEFGSFQSNTGGLILWDLDGESRKPVLIDQTGRLTSVLFTPSGDRLISGSTEGTVGIWDLRPTARGYAPIQSAVLLSKGSHYDWLRLGHCTGWLVTTPQGYYDCSLEASQFVVWRMGNEIFPFDQFEEKFHRPDLVRKALAGEDISNAQPLDATQIPPNVAFVSPKYGSELDQDKVEVEIQAAGMYPIKRLDVAINGQPLPMETARALEIDKPSEKQRTFRLTVPLPPGEPRVRLRAVAYDSELLKSKPDELVLYRPGVKQSVGALHVLSVGIDRYKSPAIPQLRYAAADARALAEEFAKQGDGKPYTKVISKVLTDSDATLSNLKFALRELKDTATENDVAVVFISGHGVRDKEGSFCFGTCDLDLRDLSWSALSWQDFVSALREVRAKRVLVLADTCHAGGIVGDQAAGSEVLAYRLNKEAHRLVFVSSGRDEASIGREEWGHGAFTKALLEALAGAADVGEKDGNITFRELRDYVPKRVEELTEGRQHPQLPFLDNYEPDAVLVRVPRAELPASGVAPWGHDLTTKE